LPVTLIIFLSMTLLSVAYMKITSQVVYVGKDNRIPNILDTRYIKDNRILQEAIIYVKVCQFGDCD